MAVRPVTWTASHSIAFDRCPRAFLFAYSGTGRSSYGSGIRTPAELIGMAVHDAIEFHIRGWSEARLPSWDATIARGTESLSEGLRTSERPDQANSLAVWEATERKSRNQVERLVNRFLRFVWPGYENDLYVAHEKTFQFKVNSIPVVVRPDFVSKGRDGSVRIVDWKTYGLGAVHLTQEWTQLAAYLLWASIDPNLKKLKAEGRIVSILTGETRPVFGDPNTLKSIRARLRNDWEVWQSMEPKSYPARPDGQKCLECPFIMDCPEGQSVVPPIRIGQEE